MIRALSILAAVAALAVSAAPVASAGPNTLKYNGHAGLGTNTKALTGTEAVLPMATSPTTPRAR